jgi:hypothetical protein
MAERIQKHTEAIEAVTWDLLAIAMRLCPGEWVLQIEISFDDKKQRSYIAVVHNGDDNVTGKGKTIAAALADLINYLLHGAVIPLAGGNNGRYVHPADRGWIKDPSETRAQNERN